MSAELFGTSLLQEVYEESLSSVSLQFKSIPDWEAYLYTRLVRCRLAMYLSTPMCFSSILDTCHEMTAMSPCLHHLPSVQRQNHAVFMEDATH